MLGLGHSGCLGVRAVWSGAGCAGRSGFRCGCVVRRSCSRLYKKGGAGFGLVLGLLRCGSGAAASGRWVWCAEFCLRIVVYVFWLWCMSLMSGRFGSGRLNLKWGAS